MKRLNLSMMMFAMMFAALSFSACSKSDDDLPDFKNDYDVLQINGVKYACYGYRSIVTYVSTWDLSHHTGRRSGHTSVRSGKPDISTVR